MLWFVWLACAPETPDGGPAAAGRTAPALDEPTLAFDEPSGVHRLPETAVGECVQYDADGAVVRRIEVTGEGLPLRIEWPSGGLLLWRRTRDDASVTRIVRVYGYDDAQSEAPPRVVEEYDARGLLLARHADDADGEWTYDDHGRLLSWDESPNHVEYQYTPAGQLDGYTTEDRHTVDYVWDGVKLLGHTYSRLDIDYETVWSAHHATGLPESGRTYAWKPNGERDSWAVHWTYDDDGNALRYQDAFTTQEWTWADGHVIAQEHTRTDRSGDPVIDEWYEHWTRDDEGRIVEHDYNGDLRTWRWDADGDLAGSSNQYHTWAYEGDCPASLFPLEMPLDPTPNPLPEIPEAPLPFGG